METTRGTRVAHGLRGGRLGVSLLMVGVVTALVVMGGCDSEAKRLEKQYAAALAGPSAVSAGLRKAFLEKMITANGAIDLAHERLETAGDASSVAFARAVLDFVDQVEPEIVQAGVNDLFWTRVGTLAGSGAAVAWKGQDLGTARLLVLAKPERWQTELYWTLHPGHDALASLVLHENGESDAALARLRGREGLAEEVEEVKRKVEEEVRRRPPK